MRLTGARVPALDGLRAIAVLMVMACHFDTGQFTLAGVMGVTVFFTLSGFLITALLLEEHDRTGRINWRGFYLRRARRLLPGLAVMLLVVCALTLAGAPTGVQPGMVAAIVGYVSNWYLMATTVGGQVQWNALSHTWSLAIEEQFYLVWPVVVLLAARWGRRGVLAIASVGAVASVSWGLASGRSNLYTDVSAYGLLVGCVLAAWVTGRPGWRVPAWVPAIALVPLAVLTIAEARTVAYVAVPLLTAAAIYTAVQVEVRWLASPPLVWIGRRSYGLYLWHVPVAYLASYALAPWAVVAPVGVAVSFGLAALSWRFVESPFLTGSRRRSGSLWMAARCGVRC